MKKTVFIAALALSLGGCVSYQELAKEANTVTAQAEKEVKAAKKMEYIWRDTEAMLKASKKASADAKKANAAGDGGKAKELAKKAKSLAAKALEQAKLAQIQAKAEAGAKPYYPN